MQPEYQHSRINLTDLKAQIMKKLGQERFKRYFYYLNKFLSLKVSKVEFDKHCLGIFGREHIALHNQFILSILRNACGQKGPPRDSYKDDRLKNDTQTVTKEINPDVFQNGCRPGDVVLLSPRKTRTCYRDRKSGERRSGLGFNGKTSFVSQLPSATPSRELNVVFENGDLNPPHFGGPAQHHQGVRQQIQNENEIFCSQPAKTSPSPIYMKEHTGIVIRDDGRQIVASSPLEGPLGVPLCPVNTGGVQGALPQASSIRCICASNNGVLLDSPILKEQMEQIAVEQGLDGVSIDCANILNHGLDSYLKGLIMSCIELVGSRSAHECAKNSILKLRNGVRLVHHYQLPNSNKPLEVQEQKFHLPISLHDLRVALELNPQQLGENWPLLLEKTAMHAFEE